jgi:hypothetical protein
MHSGFFGPGDQVMAVDMKTFVVSHVELQLVEVASGKIRGWFRPKGYVPDKPGKGWSEMTLVWVALAASPDGKKVVVGNFHNYHTQATGPHELRLWDVATGEVGPPIPGEADPLTGIAFSPDGLTFAAREKGTKLKIQRYSMTDGNPVGPPFVVQVSPSNKPHPYGMVLNCGNDGVWRVADSRVGLGLVDVYDLEKGISTIPPIEVDYVDQLQFSSSGEHLIAVSSSFEPPQKPAWLNWLRSWFGPVQDKRYQSNRLQVIEVKSGKEVFHLESSCEGDSLSRSTEPFHAAIAPDGQHLAVHRDGKSKWLEYWDWKSSQTLSWPWAALSGSLTAACVWQWQRGRLQTNPK